MLSEPVMWRLHRQLEQIMNYDAIAVEMEFRLSDESSVVDRGRLDLYFMELHASENVYLDGDSSIVSHRPWIWLLDVHCGSKTAASKTILHCTFSGNGRHAATLALSSGHLVLELWEIGGDEMSRATAKSDSDIDAGQRHSQQPVPCAMVQTRLPSPWERLDAKSARAHYSVSMSWDGSQAALIDASTTDLIDAGGHADEEKKALLYALENDYRGLFAVFRYDHSHPLQVEQPSHLTRSGDQVHCEMLNKFFGYGKFHITGQDGKDAQDEVFIACAKHAIQIFSVSQRWKLLRTISSFNINGRLRTTHGYSWWGTPRPSSFLDFSAGCWGSYLAWRSWPRDNALFVWDINQGFPIPVKSLGMYASAKNTSYSISNDGSLIVILGNGVISVNEIASGMELQSVQLPKEYHRKPKVQFIRNGLQLLVHTEKSDTCYNRGRHGLILDTSDLSIVARILPPGDYINVMKSPGLEDKYYAAHGSKLYQIHLQDYFIQPYSRPYLPTCDKTCNNASIDLLTYSQEHRTMNGLQFQVTLENFDEQPTVIVTMAHAQNPEVTRDLRIPVKSHLNGLAVFLNVLDRLVVKDEDTIMLWSLPDTVDGDLTLLFYGIWSECYGGWATCPHQQLLCPDQTPNGDQPKEVKCLLVEKPYIFNNSLHFLTGLHALLHVDPKNSCMKTRVGRYISQHINRTWPMQQGRIDLVSYLYRAVRIKIYHFEQVFSAVFGSPLVRWVPNPDMNHSTNPITILLSWAKSEPQALQYADIIIKYCIQQAKINKDMRLLLPVMQCLHDLTDSTQPHADLALRVLRQLAHFPVKHRNFLMDNYIVINPPELQLRYWRRDERVLYQCKDPILQMVYPLRKNISRNDDLNEYFADDLFAASFDLLWRANVSPSSKVSPKSRRVPLVAFPSRFMIVLHFVRYKFSLIQAGPVKTHDFHLDMLDNPAIVALIAYKWNAIGFNYWLVRFLPQCCFYALVLTAVFKHIYDDHTRAPADLFIAILVSSSIFLWLEMVQMTTNWKRYRSSLFNVVDLAAFGLPFAGSINQLYIISGRIQGRTANEGNAGIFSFAVIFIFLHILFELRINKAVCHFVTIIIRVIIQIRIFFFIFTAGIISFTIATLHIVRACPFEECSEPTTKLPVYFFYALSATYFFMGGRYDAVNEDFNSENWQFHVLMMIYFFFTVILMLNVLIALINVAFNDGDETWRRVWAFNRLQVIESAENLSYQIPGYRESSPWFPKEIYYSATKRQVREFRAKYLLDDNQDASKADRSHQSNTEYPLTLLQTQQCALKREMRDMRDQSKNWNEKLQEQSTDLKTQNDELKVQLKALQTAFDTQAEDLKAILKGVNQLLPTSS